MHKTKSNIQRILAVPALIDDNIIGVIAIANSPSDYTDDDMVLLERMVNLYAIAIQRKYSEKDLRIKNSAIETSINAIALFNLNGKLNYANSAFLKIWGYKTEQEVLNTHFSKFWEIRYHFIRTHT